MSVHNQRFEIGKCPGDKILDNVLKFFKENVKGEVIRWAIVDVKNDNFVVEASIMED